MLLLGNKSTFSHLEFKLEAGNVVEGLTLSILHHQTEQEVAVIVDHDLVGEGGKQNSELYPDLRPHHTPTLLLDLLVPYLVLRSSTALLGWAFTTNLVGISQLTNTSRTEMAGFLRRKRRAI